MDLALLDAKSLTRELACWEAAEYVCAGLVTVACIGEYVADFTNFGTGGIRARKERLAKRSTLLLIASLALELVCLVRTNYISGMLIGSLAEKATEARDRAEEARNVSLQANTLAAGARQQVTALENEIVSIRNRAAVLSTQLMEALHKADEEKRARLNIEARIADRKLTDAQIAAIAANLKSFSGQTFGLTTYEDLTEPRELSRRIRSALTAGGWKYVKVPGVISLLPGIGGVLVFTYPSTNSYTRQAAEALVKALSIEGITTELEQAERESNIPDASRIDVDVGTKP